MKSPFTRALITAATVGALFLQASTAAAQCEYGVKSDGTCWDAQAKQQPATISTPIPPAMKQCIGIGC